MPSPFPGMDPRLESEEVFPDLHDSLIFLLKEAINDVLPPGYVATSRTRVLVDDELRRKPDVALFGKSHGDGNLASPMGLAGLVAVGQQLSTEPIEEPYLEILSNQGKRLVTVIEVISLTNNRAGEKGRKTYQQKQQEYQLDGVNLVDINLLRAGPHVSATPLNRIRKILGEFDYHVSVVVAGKPPLLHAAAIRLANRLPAFAIPLDSSVAPAMVDLRPLLNRCYDSGKYAALIDYRAHCEPPLTSEQKLWAEGILAANGLLS